MPRKKATSAAVEEARAFIASSAMVETRELYVPLTPDEVFLKSQEMATAERLLGEAERAEDLAMEQWKATKNDLTAKVQDARARLARVGTVVREKRELRTVEVTEVPDDEHKLVQTVRRDTGEIIETRGMYEDELQHSLFDVSRARRLKDQGEGEGDAPAPPSE